MTVDMRLIPSILAFCTVHVVSLGATFQELTSAAQGGDPKAQLLLGIDYQFGLQGCKRDMVPALFWYTKSAMSGNGDALFNLGACYEDGDGVTKDLSEAYAYYILSKFYNRRTGVKERIEELENRLSPSEIAKGNARSKEIYYLINPQEKEAEIRRQQEEAKRQLAAAKDEAARRQEALKERARQLDLLKARAERGEPDAEFMLGCFHASGVEAKFRKDDYEAASWFLKAAMQGHAEAQYRIGVCYYEGKGTPRDILQAYAFVDIAADHFPEASAKLSVIQKDMTDAQIMVGPKRSRELRKLIEASLSKKAAR